MTLRILEAPSLNHEPRPDGLAIDTLILHYTGMRTGAEAIARLRDAAAIVSAHYVVEKDGTIFRLVAEGLRARHAGISHWRGQSALNANSIGIEIVNPGHEWGYRPFPALQMAAVADLCLEILARHPIPPWNVVGHSDVAPDRKQDPGEFFDWQGLAANGIGFWPGLDGPAARGDALQLLGRIGYRTDLPLDVLVTAFQRHWRQEAVHGLLDPGTLARLRAVAAALPVKA